MRNIIGNKNPMYDKKHTDETRKKMRENHWSKKGLKPWNFGLTKETNEQLARISIKMKNNNPMKNPNVAKKQSATIRKRYKEGLQPFFKTHKWTKDGEICWCGTNHGLNPSSGHKFNGELCPKCDKVHKDMTGKNNVMADLEIRERYLSKIKVVTKNPERNKKISLSKIGDKNPMKRLDLRLKNSKTMKKLYEDGKSSLKNDDSEFIKKRIKGLIKKPNKPEQKLNQLLQERFPNEWKYVGDGQVIFGRYCPDFINCNGKKQIIEVFGDYWHQIPKNKARDVLRFTEYSKFGFKTLIIWEHELKNPEHVIQKVNEFQSR